MKIPWECSGVLNPKQEAQHPFKLYSSEADWFFTSASISSIGFVGEFTFQMKVGRKGFNCHLFVSLVAALQPQNSAFISVGILCLVSFFKRWLTCVKTKSKIVAN